MPVTEGDDHYPEALHKIVLASYMYLTQENIKVMHNKKVWEK